MLLGIDSAHNDNIVTKAEHRQHAVALYVKFEALANRNKEFDII
jgi:hypothetical protein